MSAWLVPLIAFPAALLCVAAIKHRAVVNRAHAELVAAMEARGFQFDSKWPWTAKGTHDGLPVTITTEPVRLLSGATGDTELRGTRITVRAPTGEGRVCAYIHDRTLLRAMRVESLSSLQLDPAFDKKFLAAATDPNELAAWFDEEKRRRLLQLGIVVWVEISDGAVTLMVDGGLASAPRVLDLLDLVVAIATKRPPTRPMVTPKLGLVSYWSLVVFVPFVAFWMTLIASGDPALTAHFAPLAEAPDAFVRKVAMFDAICLTLLSLVGLCAVVFPIQVTRRE